MPARHTDASQGAMNSNLNSPKNQVGGAYGVQPPKAAIFKLPKDRIKLKKNRLKKKNYL